MSDLSSFLPRGPTSLAYHYYTQQAIPFEPTCETKITFPTPLEAPRRENYSLVASPKLPGYQYQSCRQPRQTNKPNESALPKGRYRPTGQRLGQCTSLE